MKYTVFNLKTGDFLLQLFLLISMALTLFVLNSNHGFIFLGGLCIYQLISNCIHLYNKYNLKARKQMLWYMLIYWTCILSLFVPAINGNNVAAYILIYLAVFVWIPMTVVYILWYIILTVSELSRIEF